jgi:DUF2075 family protein
MELLIIGGIIAAIIFVLNIFAKYKEGRNALANLFRMQAETHRMQAEIQELRKKLNKLEEISPAYNLCKDNLQKLKKKYDKLHERNEQRAKRLVRLEGTIQKKDDLYESLEKTEGIFFSNISSLIADFKTIQYDISAEYLENKNHPAHVEARRIKELKKLTKETIKQSKMVQYKYDYLFTIFPELEMYVDSIEEMDELHQFDNLSDLQSRSDQTKKYISKEEYKSLSEEERNQLALDRYVENQKSKWEIGRDYELYVGHMYTSEGWDVEYFGIEKKLNDMGRDLIANKDSIIHIVQCKYWSQTKQIHEKHIAHLYGTTVQYKLSESKDTEVVPVFITNITLSYMAKKFADYLGVMCIEKEDFEEFPRIKCKVNRDEFGQTKIYHLPMDQQYDRTKISSKEDLFAYTVEEAMSKGFRRAHRWYGNS